MKRLACLAVAALALAGCSQMAALTPVGGDKITAARIATNDVLVAQGIKILVAPVCTTVPEGFTCTGTTVDGQEIVANAGPTPPQALTITVGGSPIFQGTVQDVLAKAAQEAS